MTKVDLIIKPKEKRISLKIQTDEGIVVRRVFNHSEPIHYIYESKEENNALSNSTNS